MVIGKKSDFAHNSKEPTLFVSRLIKPIEQTDLLATQSFSQEPQDLVGTQMCLLKFLLQKI